jgi:prevent-host-death family protein
MQIIRIGVRDAKIHLSKLLEDVQKGKEVIITNHEKPVAKIVPVSQESLSPAERIERLERQGWIDPRPAENRRPLPPPLPVAEEVAQKFLQDERES